MASKGSIQLSVSALPLPRLSYLLDWLIEKKGLARARQLIKHNDSGSLYEAMRKEVLAGILDYKSIGRLSQLLQWSSIPAKKFGPAAPYRFEVLPAEETIPRE
jgi:hypothetical protein